MLQRAIYLLILVWWGDHWIATCLVMIIFWLLEILIQKLVKWLCLSFVKHNLQNLVKDPTCYKNPSKPTCIDLILTNFAKSFQHA